MHKCQHRMWAPICTLSLQFNPIFRIIFWGEMNPQVILNDSIHWRRICPLIFTFIICFIRLYPLDSWHQCQTQILEHTAKLPHFNWMTWQIDWQICGLACWRAPTSVTGVSFFLPLPLQLRDTLTDECAKLCQEFASMAQWILQAGCSGLVAALE